MVYVYGEYELAKERWIYIFLELEDDTYKSNEAVNVQVFKHLSTSMRNAFPEK